MRYTLLFSFLLLLLSSTVFAQNDGQWIHFTYDEHFPFTSAIELATDENNVLWASIPVGLFWFDGENWDLYYYRDIEADDHCRAMVFDDEGKLHFVAGAYITYCDSIWSGQIGGSDGPSGKDPVAIDVAPNGDVWIVTDNSGIFHFNGTSWRRYTMEDGLPTDSFVSIAVDMSGNVWCGTRQDGVLCYNGVDWTQYTEEHGLGGTNSIIVTVGPDGVVWCCGQEWIAQYKGYHIWEVFQENPLTHSIQVFEIGTTGNIWISDSVSFASYDGIDWDVYFLPDKQAIILSLAIDTNGVVWIGTLEDTLYRFVPNPTAVEETEAFSVPVSITGNYPNPFNPATAISFTLHEQGHVSLSVYNLFGQKVATLFDSPMSAGTHQAVFDGSNLASGMYFYRIMSGKYVSSGKMVLVK